MPLRNNTALGAHQASDQVLTRDNANQIAFLIDNRGQTKPGRA
jgi:hypothetical protein